jgi:hypothetical protein
MPTFKIWYIEQRNAPSRRQGSEPEAREKAGLRADGCEIHLIPEESIVGRTAGIRKPRARLSQGVETPEKTLSFPFSSFF